MNEELTSAHVSEGIVHGYSSIDLSVSACTSLVLLGCETLLNSLHSCKIS